MRLFFALLLVSAFAEVSAQRYESVQSKITFFSEAAIEDIEAITSSATSFINVSTGEIGFWVQMRDFQFEKSLMQQHYNEKYMETDKYPTASFAGNIIGIENTMKGKTEVSARGRLTIHGQTKEVETKGSLTFIKGKIILGSSFVIRLEDYKIKIPKLLWQNVTESVEVKIEFTYIPTE